VACSAALPDEGRWVLCLIALARQRAQEAARHALALPLVAVMEALPPKQDVALPQGEGAGGTIAVEPLRGEGGTNGQRDTGGVRPAAHSAQGSMRCEHLTSPLREGGENGGTMVILHPGSVLRGVNNLREALASIFSLASFPAMSGAPAYKPWEERL
jgi:hypothetical protein